MRMMLGMLVLPHRRRWGRMGMLAVAARRSARIEGGPVDGMMRTGRREAATEEPGLAACPTGLIDGCMTPLDVFFRASRGMYG